MSRNVPDDWDQYYARCDRGHRYHLSEGGCDQCADIMTQCPDCGEWQDHDGDCDACFVGREQAIADAAPPAPCVSLCGSAGCTARSAQPQCQSGHC
jgi:hypothetical protein